MNKPHSHLLPNFVPGFLKTISKIGSVLRPILITLGEFCEEEYHNALERSLQEYGLDFKKAGGNDEPTKDSHK